MQSSSGYGSSQSSNSYGSNNSGGYGSSSSGSGYGSSNNDGYGSSSSGYGSSNSESSNSGYGSSNSGYGSSNNSSSMASSVMSQSTSTTMYGTTSTSTMSSSTQTVAATSTSIMYGSGSMNSGSSGSYNDCVAQCIASFAPSSTSVYSSSDNSGGSSSSSYSGSTGTGATKTVVVAPTQGVLRYVPFAINASVGDTIQFMWGANNHTVTKGSQLQLCNATGDSPFTSGEHDQGFTFTQVVNSTDPTFFFCNTPGHCQKGMFGIINPPVGFDAPSSASLMMQSLKANSSDLSTYAAYTDQTTSGQQGADWGGNILLSGMPDWAQPFAAENILFTRNLLAQNPELLQEDGSIDASSYGSTPWMYPEDVNAVVAAAGTTSSTSTNTGTSSSAAAAAAVATSSTASPVQKNTSGVSSTAPRAAVALLAVLATVFVL